MLLRAACLAFLVLASAAPLAAQSMTEAEAQQVQLALNRGQLLYSYDQAAWHGTDAMVADAKARGLSEKLPDLVGGWVVTGGVGDPVVVFYDKDPTNPRAVWIVRFGKEGSKAVSAAMVAGTMAAELDAGTRALIAARSTAFAALANGEGIRCSHQPFNVVVLPPEQPGGDSMVYFLTPQDTAERVPFGGHYRFAVSAKGMAGPMHAFTKSCIDVPTDKAKDKPKAFAVTQLLDPVPTEVGVFTMLAAQVPLYVMTDTGKRIWAVESSGGQARVRLVPEKP
jgi:hypothetical protein